MTFDCPTCERTSERLLDGDELTSLERKALDAHLAACPVCRSRHETLETLLAAPLLEPVPGLADDRDPIEERLWRRIEEERAGSPPPDWDSVDAAPNDLSRFPLVQVSAASFLAVILSALALTPQAPGLGPTPIHVQFRGLTMFQNGLGELSRSLDNILSAPAFGGAAVLLGAGALLALALQWLLLRRTAEQTIRMDGERP
ncbi:MAG: hypothetical protein GMKNLPBB_01828 [Myxococcota bacterium]|nr:hypothetical protein [Myxococcota bacterium]